MATPIKAIRKHCLECGGGSPKEVEHCLVENCNLRPFRFGTRPKTAQKKGKMV